jgi:tol-pal system protein YbgF
MRKLLLVALTGFALAASAPVFAQQDQDDDRQGGPPPPIAARDEMQFDQLSEQMRDLTGRVEELQHDIDSLRTRMEKMSSDNEMRLEALERATGVGAANGNAPPPTAMNQPPQMAPPTAMNQPPQMAPPTDNGGAPPPVNAYPPPTPHNTAPPPGAQTAMAPATPEGGTLPAGSPQQQYDYAFGLLRDANYPAAERALKDFIHRYPDNRLSGNAQYWLGETYYVRRNFQAAAAAFADGYQRFPRGPKAAEDLLKLGSSLSMLGRRADACRSFAQLDHDFPIMPANVKAKEADEKRRAGCR